MNFNKSTFCVTVIVIMLVGVVITGCSKHDTNDIQNNENPVITATENIENPVITAAENIDEALGVVWNHYDDAISVSLEGTATLRGSEYAGECYVFAAETPDGIVRVAVSKEQYILFEYIDDLWVEYTEYYTQARKWIDYYKGDMPSNDVAEWELPEFSGVKFRWTQYEVFAIEGVNKRALFQGMPVWSVYFSDINGDDLPEICSTTSYGSGMIDTRVIVYDYANDTLYELADRGIFDYYISLVDDQLFVTQSHYADYKDETAIATGELVIIDGELTAAGIDREPDESVCTVHSYDGKYKIEGYGIDYNNSVSGINPVKEIRIVEISSGKTVWNTVGLYLLHRTPQFCWSPDSRYVSVMHAARTWVDAILVDTKDMSEHSLPGLFEISQLFPEFSPNEDRADPYIIPEYWMDDHTIVVAFSWTPSPDLSPESERIEIKYQYDTNTEELTVSSVMTP